MKVLILDRNFWLPMTLQTAGSHCGDLQRLEHPLPKLHKRISRLQTVSRPHISCPSRFSTLLSRRSRMYERFLSFGTELIPLHVRYIRTQRWHWVCCLLHLRYLSFCPGLHLPLSSCYRSPCRLSSLKWIATK